eukprot:TRINITY_DN32288_c0_g1_i1.p1 TRINITY_DN32288_c0_g1~~TRINITY_DN32288_c0_g1_i1.p1  ORF type:complete len:466 (-),score=57.41 TRINITY_DN32288_c0_g1_i1:13-1410(-)
MGFAPHCGVAAEVTLHVSWAFTERDLALVPNLPRLARSLAGVLGGCIAEILLTLDPICKARGAAQAAVESTLGKTLWMALAAAGSEAVHALSNVARVVGPPATLQSGQVTDQQAPLLRQELVDYGSDAVLQRVLVEALGIPSSRVGSSLPRLAKHTVALLYAIVHCSTKFLLHFDADIVVLPIGHGIAHALQPSLGYLKNSTSWLQGLFAVTLEECISNYPKGTLDVVVPLRAKVANDYLPFSNICTTDNDQNVPMQTPVAPGDGSLEICQALCSTVPRCSAVEWYEGGWTAGRRCFHMVENGLITRGFTGPRVSNATCYVKRTGRDLAAPPYTRGGLYLRYHSHGLRGPHFSMRHYVMSVPKFRALFPLLTEPSDGTVRIAGRVAGRGAMALWRQNVETIIELRLLRAARHETWPSFAAFLSPSYASGACVCEVERSCPPSSELGWFRTPSSRAVNSSCRGLVS